MDFEQDIKINRFQLDVACERQPELYGTYAEKLAELRSRRDKLKDKLKLASAEISLGHRKNPPEGLKITDSTIASLTETDPSVIKVKDELHRVEKRFNEYDAAVTAFEHRRSMLNNLVELYHIGYFSDPDQPNTEATDAVRSNLNKRRQQED